MCAAQSVVAVKHDCSEESCDVDGVCSAALYNTDVVLLIVDVTLVACHLCHSNIISKFCTAFALSF